MFIKKFEDGDLLYNRVLVHPKTKIFIKDKKVYFKNYSPTGQNAEDGQKNNTPPYVNAVYAAVLRDYACLPAFNFSCADNSQYTPLV